MRTTLKIGFCCILLGGMVVTLWYQQRGTGRLVTEIETLRQKNKEIVVLQADNRRLIAAAPDRAEANRKKREELLRLERQTQMWRKRLEAIERGHASAGAQSHPSNVQMPSPTALAPRMMLTETMQNVGRTTPTLAMQTAFWAQSHGDVPAIVDSVAYDSEAKVKIDTLFAELSVTERAHFESPERLAAILVAEATAKRGGLPVQVVEKMQGPETAEVTLRVQLPDGQLKDAKTLRLHRYPDGWKVMFPAKEIDDIRTILSGMPPTQLARSGGN